MIFEAEMMNEVELLKKHAEQQAELLQQQQPIATEEQGEDASMTI